MEKWIRPVITIIAVSGLTVGFFLGRIPSEAYVPLMAITITYWFRARDEAKRIQG